MRLSELRGSPCCICTERELLATEDLCVAPPPLLSCRECWDTLDALLVGDEWVELDRLSDRALPVGPGLGCKCSTYTSKIESISALRSWIQQLNFDGNQTSRSISTVLEGCIKNDFKHLIVRHLEIWPLRNLEFTRITTKLLVALRHRDKDGC